MKIEINATNLRLILLLPKSQQRLGCTVPALLLGAPPLPLLLDFADHEIALGS